MDARMTEQVPPERRGAAHPDAQSRGGKDAGAGGGRPGRADAAYRLSPEGRTLNLPPVASADLSLQRSRTLRRRSTVRFRKGAPGREEYSNIHPVTFGASGALSGALFDGQYRRVTGPYLGRCEFAGHVSGSEVRICQRSGSCGGARPKLAALSCASHVTFGARTTRYGRHPLGLRQ